MADNQDELPEWFRKWLETQSVPSSSNASDKRHKPSGNHPQPSKKSRPSCDPDSDDEFDKKFGHLFEHNVYESDQDDQDLDIDDNSQDVNNNNYYQDVNDNTNNYENPSEGEESVDEDLVEILKKVPNWGASSSIRRFITKIADRPLPEDMLKTLNEDYIPSPDLEPFFSPPKMPKRLYKIISRLKSKCAIKTEQNLYAAQSELFIITKPLVAALMDLKPLGTAASQARELLSVSLQGHYSTSLKISKARRENVRFLFKEALAEALYSYEPNHVSLFGGKDFPSQVDKASKEAKADFSWDKSKKPFHKAQSQGFQGKGANKYFSRQQGRSSYNSSNNNRRDNKKGSSKKPNYPKKGHQKE